MDESAGRAFSELLSVMRRLRGEGGCPWDREQTMESIRAYVIEEAYELVDAITGGGPEEIREECGDLLLQVVFIAQMASEAGVFNASDVVRGLTDKMIRRHPHVFAGSRAESSEST